MKKWYKIGRSYVKGSAIVTVKQTVHQNPNCRWVIDLNPTMISDPKYAHIWASMDDIESSGVLQDIEFEMNTKGELS